VYTGDCKQLASYRSTSAGMPQWRGSTCHFVRGITAEWLA